MATVRLAERVTPFVGARVDPEAGVIRDALICGRESKNRRRYAAQAFGDGKQYEGAKSFADHSRDGRQVHELIGWWQNVTIRDGLPRGDFHVLKASSLGPVVLEAAERNPNVLGFSHVAQCRTKPGADGWETVESVGEVESIDLVTDPATTKGLHEGTNKGRPVAIKLGRYLEAVAKLPKATVPQVLTCKQLAEMDGLADLDMPADAPAPEGDADPDEAIDSAFESAGVSVWKAFVAGDIDLAACLSKLKALAKAHGDVSDDGGSGGKEGDKPAEESAKPIPGLSIREASAALKKAGLKTVEIDHAETYAALPEPLREGYARDLLRAAAPPAETPISVGRGQAGSTKQTTEAAAKPPTDDPAAFRKYVTESAN